MLCEVVVREYICSSFTVVGMLRMIVSFSASHVSDVYYRLFGDALQLLWIRSAIAL